MTVATIGAISIGNLAEAVSVMLFYQVGELFQSYAVDKSRKSISDLMDIRPDYANVIRNDKHEKVDPSDVNIEEIILIKPGEKVPLDGVVIEGSSMMDTSALTGESVPRTVKKGDKITVDISYEQGKAGNISCFVNGLDEDVWNSAYSKLSDEMLEVTNHSDTHISGTITVKDSGTFVTSIPYEKGWSIKVDGKKVEPKKIANALVGVELTAGEHEISMKFTPNGWWSGVILLILGILCMIALQFHYMKFKNDMLAEYKKNTKYIELKEKEEEKKAAKTADKTDNKSKK